MTNEPSPRPWRVEQPGDECRFWTIRNPEGISVCTAWREDDAALIVDAVNEHDRLLAAMKAIEDLCKVLDRTDLWEDRVEYLDDAIYYIRKEARAAIGEDAP